MVFINIKEDEVGIVYKRFGRPLPAGRRVALNGESGLQAEVLTPGRHLSLPNVEIRIAKAIVIASDEVGLVDAKDGASLRIFKMLGYLSIMVDKKENNEPF